jgi:hypothetical protein
MSEKTTKETLNLLIKGVSRCVTESGDKVAQSLLGILKTLAADQSKDLEEWERNRRTMRGLVMLIKDRLEGVNALGVTLCGCLAEVLLQITFTEATTFKKEIEVKVLAEQGVKSANIPQWVLEAFYMWKQGVGYAEIGKRLGVARQVVRYWVQRLNRLNPKFSEESKEPEALQPEQQPTSASPEDSLWRLLHAKTKG